MNNPSAIRNPAISPQRVQRRRWLLNLATMAVAVLVWTIVGPVAGVDLTVRLEGTEQEVTQLAVISASLLAGSAAWGSLTILERISSNARRIWVWIATAALAVSLLGPLSATNPAATAALALLHLVVGLSLIIGMPRDGLSGIRHQGGPTRGTVE